MTEDPHIQGQAMTEDPIITVDDVIKAGHCVVPGLRDWCAAHGLDFRTFVKTGYPASTLLATGDALAVRVLALQESRHGG